MPEKAADKSGDDSQYTESETAKRMEGALKRAFTMPHRPRGANKGVVRSSDRGKDGANKKKGGDHRPK